MDREISKEVQRKEQRKQFIRIGTAVGGFIVLIVVVISMLQTSLKRKDLNISTVDKGDRSFGQCVWQSDPRV